MNLEMLYLFLIGKLDPWCIGWEFRQGVDPKKNFLTYKLKVYVCRTFMFALGLFAALGLGMIVRDLTKNVDADVLLLGFIPPSIVTLLFQGFGSGVLILGAIVFVVLFEKRSKPIWFKSEPFFTDVPRLAKILAGYGGVETLYEITVPLGQTDIPIRIINNVRRLIISMAGHVVELTDAKSQKDWWFLAEEEKKRAKELWGIAQRLNILNPAEDLQRFYAIAKDKLAQDKAKL